MSNDYLYAWNDALRNWSSKENKEELSVHDMTKCPNCEVCISNLREENTKLRQRNSKLEMQLKEADEVREILEGLIYHITNGKLSKVYPLDTLKALYDDDMTSCVEQEAEPLRKRIKTLEGALMKIEECLKEYGINTPSSPWVRN